MQFHEKNIFFIYLISCVFCMYFFKFSGTLWAKIRKSCNLGMLHCLSHIGIFFSLNTERAWRVLWGREKGKHYKKVNFSLWDNRTTTGTHTYIIYCTIFPSLTSICSSVIDFDGFRFSWYCFFSSISACKIQKF